MNYPTKPRNYHLTPSRKTVGRAVARGSKKQVVSECMKDPKMKMYTIELMGRQLRNELISLCSNATNSTLQNQSADALREFTWGKLHSELEARAPTLLSLLQMCTHTRKPRHNRIAVIGMCVALLLKLRFHKMCLIQKILSLLLYAGHSGKQVCKTKPWSCVCDIDFYMHCRCLSACKS